MAIGQWGEGIIEDRERKLAWMAAVVETRGRLKCVNNAMRRNSAQLTLRVQSQNLPLGERLAKMTGTAVTRVQSKTFDESNRRGCTEHCPEPHVHVTIQMPATIAWHLTGVGAAIVLHNLMPYLLNTEKIQSFIDDVIAATPASGRGRPAVNKSIARLRELGWSIPAELEPDGDEQGGEEEHADEAAAA